MSIVFFKRAAGSFTVRVFWTWAAVVLFVSLFFAGISIYQQKLWLGKDLVAKGLTAVKNLAYNSRLGVFTENRDTLIPLMKYIKLESEDIVYAAVYNLDGKILDTGELRENKEQFMVIPQLTEEVKNSIYRAGQPFWRKAVLNKELIYEFWAPVTVSKEVQDEALVLEGPGSPEGTEESAILPSLGGVKGKYIGFALIGFSLKQINKRTDEIILISLSLLVLYLPIGLVIAFFFARTVTSPIGRLVQLAETVAEGDLSHTIDLKRTDELGRLAVSFNKMLSTIRARNYEIIQHRQQLEDINIALEQRVQDEIAKNREKEQIMIHQGRLSAMGEMLGNIAHQWRQPLNTIGIIIQDLRDIHSLGGLTGEYLDKNTQKAMELVRHMSKTIDDFRNFYKPDKDKQPFDLKTTIAKAISIVELSFLRDGIRIETDMEENILVDGYQNEYAQALMNILSNARDALHKSDTTNAVVKIKAFRDLDYAVVTVTDNAGGIPEEIKDRIFEPYFTTRKKGTGIGLYMTKMIIENSMDGKLTVRNTGDGAEFVIVMPLKEKTWNDLC